jgi:PAS domain S-box-containing protein
MARLEAEMEQLQTALEDAQDERAAMALERDYLAQQQAETYAQLRRVKRRNHILESAAADRKLVELGEAVAMQEELRVAIEELQALSEELETSNAKLKAANESLDRRIGERTRSLRESEERLRTLMEGIPQLVWRAEATGKWTWASPQWSAFTGLSRGQSRGHGWLMAVHPEDRQTALAAWEKAVDMGAYDTEYRLRRNADDGYRWFQARATPMKDDAGRIVEWLGTSTDVHETRQLQARQGILVAELQHRVRNTLAVVRSIVGRTAATAPSTEALVAELEGRISALARGQSLVGTAPEKGVDLRLLIEGEIEGHVGQQDRMVLSGVAVTLRPRAAETLALAFHELATNAAKYGALSAPQGRVDVTWTIEDADLRLTWRESGVSLPGQPPVRRGFGTELITGLIPYELDARCSMEFGTDGLQCTLTIPLTTLALS